MLTWAEAKVLEVSGEVRVLWRQQGWQVRENVSGKGGDGASTCCRVEMVQGGDCASSEARVGMVRVQKPEWGLCEFRSQSGDGASSEGDVATGLIAPIARPDRRYISATYEITGCMCA
jgi:hypothetical protein